LLGSPLPLPIVAKLLLLNFHGSEAVATYSPFLSLSPPIFCCEVVDKNQPA